MKAIAANANLDFLSRTANELILEQEPPRLQAVLRMVESKIKLLNYNLKSYQAQISPGDMEHLLKLTQESLAQQMNNQVPDVRKTVVFCMVEVCESIGVDLFQSEVMEKHMSVS